MKYSQAVLVACIGASTVAINGVSARASEKRDLSNVQFKREVEFDMENLFTRNPEHQEHSEFVPKPLTRAKPLSSYVVNHEPEFVPKPLTRARPLSSYATREQHDFVPKPLTRARPLAFRDFSETEDLSLRDFDGEAALDARMFDNFRQKYREAKAQRLQNKAQKWALKAGGGTGSTGDGSDTSTTRDLEGAELDARSLGDMWKAAKALHKEHKVKKLERQASKAAGKAAAASLDNSGGSSDYSNGNYNRDLADDLSLRDFALDDELEARMFDHFRQKYREAKAQRLANKAEKWALKAGGGSTAGDMSGDGSGSTTRDLAAEDAIFEARDLVSEDGIFEARSMGDMWRGWKAERKEGKAHRLQEQANLAAGTAAAAAASGGSSSLNRRDVESINDLD